MVPYGSYSYSLRVEPNGDPLLVVRHGIRIIGGSETKHNITSDGIKLVGRYLDIPEMAQEDENGLKEETKKENWLRKSFC